MNSENPVNPTAAGGESGTGRHLTAELWQQVKQRFAAALQLEPPARQAFLDSACGGDPVMRAEVESLLAFAHQNATSPQPLAAPEHSPLASGTRLGDYEVVSLLGSGGFGGAYRARDLRLQREVAIKVLPSALSADAAALRRFEREALAAARLNHPHIVTIHSIEHAGDVHLIVMELVEGQTLNCMIPQGGLSLEKFLDLATQLADAVAAAHGKGIIHRDLKPGNIMVDNRGSIKILDFGIAKMTELAAPDASDLQETEPGLVMGTVPYMSPEQLEGKKLGCHTDIFSLGAVLYQMATGQRPFQGETHAKVISSILRDQPRPVMELRADLPASLQRILERCLAKEVGERYTASQLCEAVQQLRQEFASGQLSGSASKTVNIPRVRSLAVLPLENLSHDPEQDYFAEGLTEALITTLAKIGELRVVSRSSVMRYKGIHKPLREIARELGVDGIVEGTVMRDGQRVRISAQLIDPANETHLWAESYERHMRKVLTLQSEVARAIAKEVQVKLTPLEEAQFAQTHSVDPEAYEAYLKARYFWNRRGAGIGRAVQFFREAIAKDPNYAAPYAGLADCMSVLGFWAYVPPEEGCRRGKELALKALEMDRGLAEAHASLAWTTMLYDYDFMVAEREFERSIELNPRYATAHQWFGVFLMFMGRYEEAYTELQRAFRLEPYSLIIRVSLGWAYYLARRDDQAIEQYQKALELDPSFVPAHFDLGFAYVEKGMYDAAVTQCQKGAQISEGAPQFLAALGVAYAAAGRHDEARGILTKLQQVAKHKYVSPYLVARLHAALAEKEEALQLLEGGYRERDAFMTMLKVDPGFDTLRGDLRFQDLMRRMNFPM